MRIRVNVQVVRESTPRRRSRRRPALVGLVVLALGVGVPFAFGSGLITGFADVPPSSPNHDAIDRVTNAGIMTPCQTSPQLLFCPTTPLGRQWAAANYDRMLGLNGTPGNFVPTFKSVNVITGGSTPPFIVDSTQKVTNLNADQLDGQDASAFLPVGGKAADADKLDGQDSTDFQRHCSNGSVLAWAYVRGDVSGFPSTYSSSSAYVSPRFNCAGANVVRVARTSGGRFRVSFPGISDSAMNSGIMVATVTPVNCGACQYVSYTNETDTEGKVIQVKLDLPNGNGADTPFAIVLVGYGIKPIIP